MSVISGAHRSGKSRASLLFRALVDPSTGLPFVHCHEPEDNLWVAAQNERLLAFDNVSKVSNAEIHELCESSTGGGSSTRQFYSNSAQVLFDAKRPIPRYAIAPQLTRPDLIHRSVFIFHSSGTECDR